MERPRAGETPSSRSCSINGSDPSEKGVVCASRELLLNLAEDDGFTATDHRRGLDPLKDDLVGVRRGNEIREEERNSEYCFLPCAESAMTADSRREGAG